MNGPNGFTQLSDERLEFLRDSHGAETILTPACLTIPAEAITRIHAPFSYNPPSVQLNIIHQDHKIVVLDKPSGLLTVPGKTALHADCLETRLQSALPDARLVHRLDKDTSGLIVFARDAQTHRNLGLQFERRHVRKTYIARVAGQVVPDSGLIAAPIRCDWPNRPLQTIDWDQGRPAQTLWRVIKREADATRLELTPITGRSHQLRVHLLAIGHTILGDRFYASDSDQRRAVRLQLHAAALQIIHPATGERILYESSCPF